MLKASDGMLQLAEANGGGSDDEGAVCDGFAERLELFCPGEQRRGADRGTRLAKCQLIRVHHAKMEESEVAHRPGGGADVEGIAWADEYDAQAVEFGMERQGRRVYSRIEVMK